MPLFDNRWKRPTLAPGLPEKAGPEANPDTTKAALLHKIEKLEQDNLERHRLAGDDKRAIKVLEENIAALYDSLSDARDGIDVLLEGWREGGLKMKNLTQARAGLPEALEAKGAEISMGVCVRGLQKVRERL